MSQDAIFTFPFYVFSRNSWSRNQGLGARKIEIGFRMEKRKNKAGMEEETRALDLARNGVAGGNGVNIDDAGKRLIGGCLTRTMHMLRSIRRD